MRPDAHFQQHHDVEAPRVDATSFVPAWRVRTRLDGLLSAEAITPREWFAATSYRREWDAAFGGLGASLSAAYASSRGTGDYYAIRRLDALTALRAARRRIGSFACRLIEACAVEDMCWRDLGLALGIDHKTAREWTIAAVKLLAMTQRGEEIGNFSPRRFSSAPASSRRSC